MSVYLWSVIDHIMVLTIKINTMKKLQIALTMFLFAVLASSCDYETKCVNGSGGYSSKDYALKNFSQISVDGDADVTITQDTFTAVRVEAQWNVLEALNVDVYNGELRIGRKNCFRNSKTIKVYITTPSLSAVDLSGSGSVKGIGTFTTSDFRADISGSADMSMHVVCDNFSSSISGSGNMTFNGIATVQYLDISGSGDVHCFGLSGKRADVRISGSGNCEVNVTDNLDVKISGSGNVYYKNQPAINSKVSGSGSLIHKG